MTNAAPEAETRLGILSAIAAYSMWGMLPLFLIALRGVGADEVLVHRVLWSVPFGAAIITARGQWADVRRALTSRPVALALAASATIIAINWLVYIAAVQSGNIFQASLGYYINPLIYVLAGVVLLGERLSKLQLAAVALATTGVLILTLYGGRFPTISLVLGITFTVYGLLRKQTPVGAMPGLFIETLLLAPIAVAYLAFFGTMQEVGFGETRTLTLLLLAAGPVTVLPLLCFAIAARRLPLSLIGFLQFIGPTLQFLIGVIDGEPFTRAHQVCFVFIWTAAAVFAADAIIKGRKRTTPRPA
jgi:chloramphenicol-sensitive protein RarD